MAVRRRIGLLGGSFDPVHLAHIRLAQAALEFLALTRVEMLPAAMPWQRGDLRASAQHRQNMLEIACANKPGLLVNPLELRRAGKTYTIDTLEELPDEACYYWIMGADQLMNFCTWHRWQDILQRAKLAVAQRPGSELKPPAELSTVSVTDQIITIPFDASPISSTDIRQALARGEDTSNMLDPAVLAYIQEHGLYH